MPQLSAALLSIEQVTLSLPPTERHDFILGQHTALFTTLPTSPKRLAKLPFAHAATAGFEVPNFAAPSPANISGRLK